MTKGRNTFRRRCGIDRLVVQFFPSLHQLSKDDVEFVVYAAYVCARIISRVGRIECKHLAVEQWAFTLSLQDAPQEPCDDDRRLMNCVKDILNGWNVVRAYEAHREIGTPTTQFIEMWKYSVVVAVFSSRLHDVIKDEAYDVRYRQFRKTWASCVNDEGRARALAVWVVTRSVDLLELLDEDRNGPISDEEFLSHDLFKPTKRQKKKDGEVLYSSYL